MPKSGPKRLTSQQLRQQGARPDRIRVREQEERGAQRPLGLVPRRVHPIPTVPRGLAGKARLWFAETAKNFVFESHMVPLLTAAAWAMQRAEQARAILGKEGIMVKDAFGKPIPNPAVVIERTSAQLFAKLLRQLDLPEE